MNTCFISLRLFPGPQTPHFVGWAGFCPEQSPSTIVVSVQAFLVLETAVQVKHVINMHAFHHLALHASTAQSALHQDCPSACSQRWLPAIVHVQSLPSEKAQCPIFALVHVL